MSSSAIISVAQKQLKPETLSFPVFIFVATGGDSKSITLAIL
jgi:hypothetical protein